MPSIIALNPPKAKAGHRVKRAGRRRKARREAALSTGRHRPVVIVGKNKRRLKRPRRSHIAPKAVFENPFLGGLVTVGNPRKHRKHRRSRRLGRRKSGALLLVNPKRRHHRRGRREISLLRNPGGAVMAPVKELVSPDFLIDAAGAAVGFVLPNIIVVHLPATWRDSQLKVYGVKTGVIIGLSVLGGVANKRLGKLLLLGGAISLALDAYTDFIAPHLMAAPAAAPQAAQGAQSSSGTAGVDWYYGAPGLEWYYGPQGGGAASLADAFAGD